MALVGDISKVDKHELKCDCGRVINPNKNQSEYKFVRAYSTPKQGEIALIKSILDGEKIPYYIKGETFGSLYGPANGLFMMDIMIQGRLY